MADYQPLLARALDALPDRSPAMRSAVYERARNALIGQLRSRDPPLLGAAHDVGRRAPGAALARLGERYGGPAAAACRLQRANETAACEKGTVQVGFEQAVERCQFHIAKHHPRHVEPSRIHQQIDEAVGLLGFVEEGFDLVLLADSVLTALALPPAASI